MTASNLTSSSESYPLPSGSCNRTCPWSDHQFIAAHFQQRSFWSPWNKTKVVQMCDLRQLSGETRDGYGTLQSLVYRYTTRNTLLFHCLCFQICSLQTHKYPWRNNRYYYYDITVMYFLVSIRTVVSNKTETFFPAILANKLIARYDDLSKVAG